MRSRRPSPEHQEAVSRRLALLSAELAGVRGELGEPGQREPATSFEAPVPEPPVLRELPAVPEPPPFPVPGRHAARRRGAGPAALVPETLRGRVALGSAQLSVIAVLVAAGLAVTCWWVVRGDATQVAAPTLVSPEAGLVAVSPTDPAAPAPMPAGATGSGAATSGTVTVDVAGKVRRPGIAVLDAGSRVVDAIRAAGGARRGVDLASLNLARLLVDGEQILVGVPAPTGLAASAVPTAGAPAALVNLNTATEVELESLPDVGPVTASAIITWRDQHGGFTAVDELLEVDGIGDATLGKLAPYVTV